MKKNRFLLSILLAAALTSCGGEEFTYSDYHCNLTIDNSKHLDQTLNSALNPNSKGIFCKISHKISSGALYFVFKNSQGLTSESIFNAIDQRLQSQNRLGMNNGVIVGYGNLSDPAQFYAYDAECPNCFDDNAIPRKSYPLGMNSSGIATCGKCGRQYNMNTGGNCINNSGRGLTTYRATTTGANGRLHIY
ncbi:hypothetical protein [Prevotella sp. KH2C16]|uniref:hypothetical protein n=1 Tax=Prevotella sp. KH2C16 TaxID=1855325 RepID=UPI0008E8AAFD|nr:hypothetical protein [Prevotella sp. KH2C16]SFF87404.1 hypothetical protein SAMN05216383_101315 [Prevotella sp. KH2C16]